MYDPWYVDAPAFDPEPSDPPAQHDPDTEPEPPFVSMLAEALVCRAREATQGGRQ